MESSLDEESSLDLFEQRLGQLRIQMSELKSNEVKETARAIARMVFLKESLSGISVRD